MVPTACFTTQLDLRMLGMSLKRLLRFLSAAGPSPSRNLQQVQCGCITQLADDLTSKSASGPGAILVRRQPFLLQEPAAVAEMKASR